MTLASFVDRNHRAIVVIAVIVSIAGLAAGFALPSDIYPPLIFPRIVIIGHSGMTPARTMMSRR